jgi:prepilin-type N-terminal cleavage/methylation domain-containing protein
MSTRRRGGYTLIELIVVTVLGSLVLGVLLQVLVINQRTYTAQAATISGQQTTRMTLDVLFNELRELSPPRGDILAMEDDSLRVRLMRKWGFVCATSFSGTPQLLVIPHGIGVNTFAVGDSVFVYADNVANRAGDDDWIAANITALSNGVACPQDGTAGQRLGFSGQSGLFSADSVGIGAPVRSYREFTFGTTTLLGDTYFGRREGNGAMIPIAGPIQATNGIEFAYRDSVGHVTSNRDEVRQIEVIVRTHSEAMNSLGEMVSDSIHTWIYTRN